jgi:hypothetical protein
MAPGAPDLGDPHWFPVDLHVPDRRFGLLRLDEDLVERAPFLDVRLDAPLADAIQVPASSIAAGPPRARIGWLFHTSFCASTLLARALHRSPYEIALKEPMVLRRLADARKSGWALEGLLEPSVALLGRPWHPDGAVVIKPTHVALNVAVSLLTATPTSRAMILTSALDDFLISNLKKPPESQDKIPILADRALRATTFGARLPPAGRRPPDLLCAAGVQWAAQRELVQDILDAVGPARIRTHDAATLLSDLPAQVWACASWLQLPVPRDRLLAHTAAVSTRNAKAMSVPYGPDVRVREAGMVVADHRGALLRARAWLDTHVLPAMRDAARRDPPPWA